MIRPLDNLALLTEVANIKGLDYCPRKLRRKHPDKIIVIKKLAYIKVDVLCEKARREITDLSDYIQISELVSHLSIGKKRILDRIELMQKIRANGGEIDLFDYIIVNNQYFIKMNKELKENMIRYQPFLMNFDNGKYAIKTSLLGDLKIGFY